MRLNLARSFNRSIRSVGCALAALCLATAVAASEHAAMLACRADAQKLCAGVPAGGGRIAACLRENEAKLTPSCQAQLGALEACAAEIKKLCPQAQDESSLRQCAKEKHSEISAGCRAAAGG